MRLPSPEKEKVKERTKEMPRALAKAEQKVAGVTIARAILMTLSFAIAVAVQKDKGKVYEDYTQKTANNKQSSLIWLQ